MPKPTPIFFTAEGLNDVQDEFDRMTESRPETVIELQRANELGDRSENAAYKVAKQKLRSIDSRLRYLRNILERAKIVAPRDALTVQIGSKVELQSGTTKRTFTLVGAHEADPAKGKLSYLSPLGEALLHKKPGESAHLSTPNGSVTHTILKIL